MATFLEFVLKQAEVLNDASNSGRLTVATGLWVGYPTFRSLAQDGEIYQLNQVHRQAAQLLVEAAIANGIDTAPLLWESAIACEEFYSLPDAKLCGLYDIWPDSIGEQITRLPSGTQDAVRRSYSTLIVLSIKLNIDPKAAATAVKSASPSATISRLPLPTDPDELQLWQLLYNGQGGDLSDNKIAENFHTKEGPKVLNSLRKKKSDKLIADWKLPIC